MISTLLSIALLLILLVQCIPLNPALQAEITPRSVIRPNLIVAETLQSKDLPTKKFPDDFKKSKAIAYKPLEGREDFKTVIEKCCSVGEKVAENSDSKLEVCLNRAPDKVAFLNITQRYKEECEAVADLCCSSRRSQIHCKEGKLDALNGRKCHKVIWNKRSITVEDFYVSRQECCTACEIGLKAKRMKINCTIAYVMVEERFRTSFLECCHGKVDDTNEISATFSQPDCNNGFRSPDGKYICNAGYRYSQEKDLCVDINECLESRPCRPDQECINTCGLFLCRNLSRSFVKCPEGYSFSNQTNDCIDIDECLLGLNSCDTSQETCVNENGSFSCQPKEVSLKIQMKALNHQLECPKGYKLNPSTGECRDIDECLDDSTCEETHRCLNVNGSHLCVRKNDCGTGYRYQVASDACRDINECELTRNICGPMFECVNIPGTYRCRRVACPIGHKLNSDGSCHPLSCPTGYKIVLDKCEDIDECATNPCPTGLKCENIPGNYLCKSHCPSGMFYNEITENCTDINECIENKHECSPNEVCINKSPGYYCDCQKGYIRDALGNCEDLNECSRSKSICPRYSTCLNTLGSYKCICEPGFRSSLDYLGKVVECVDIDECVEKPWLCLHECKNTYGSFTCTCPKGYKLSDDSSKCVDIDECSVISPITGKSAYCSGLCRNTEGSFECECPRGFYSDANGLCVDVDECKHRPCNASSICLNTHGNFKCFSFNCPEGYKRDKSNSRRCLRLPQSECSNQKCNIPLGDLLNLPMSYSYYYLSLPSWPTIPQDSGLMLLMAKGPRSPSIISRFSFQISNSKVLTHIVPANFDDFSLQQSDLNEAKLYLKKSLQGPQDVEIKLEMTHYSSGTLLGSTIIINHLHISEY